ncbi:MAG: ATP-binding protein [Actinobacteria bacterium]|nr:ATP-binding protein [Actinomycetota bacterium]
MTEAPISDEPASSPTLYSLKVCHPAVPESVPILRHAAADFAAEHGADADLCGDIALAVSEAVTNAVKHSQAHVEDPVRLTVAVVGDWLEIRVIDRGAGFGLRDSDGLGLGLPTIARLAAQLTISQEGQGTELLMRFPLPR